VGDPALRQIHHGTGWASSVATSGFGEATELLQIGVLVVGDREPKVRLRLPGSLRKTSSLSRSSPANSISWSVRRHRLFSPICSGSRRVRRESEERIRA
jgi:hypothetical protein